MCASIVENTAESQPVTEPPGRCAFFISLNITNEPEAVDTVRAFCADFPGLIRSLLIRDNTRSIKGVIGFGSDAWDRLFGAPKPSQLHTFEEIRGDKHTAPSTPADLFFHLRADTYDLCFELARQIMVKLGGAVTVLDEVHGFRSFDGRSIIGFVDGTENPQGKEAYEFALIGEEDPEFVGGSYVIVQRYEHDLTAWNAQTTEAQELAIGRRKFDDLELEDEEKPTNAHNVLTNITDENGNELKIIRDNLPYGSPANGLYGTYFIGYAKDPSVTETMLRNMFIGDPPGNHDRLLDFSTAKTGTLFFIPSFTLLDELSERMPQATGASRPILIDSLSSLNNVSAEGSDQKEATGKNADGSLAIGSLKKHPSVL